LVNILRKPAIPITYVPEEAFHIKANGPQILALAEGWLASLTRGLSILNLIWGLRPLNNFFGVGQQKKLVLVKKRFGLGPKKNWAWSTKMWVSV
jgi:hypothetical protein